VASTLTQGMDNGAQAHRGATLRVRLAALLGTGFVLCVLVGGLITNPGARAEVDVSLLGWTLLAFVASLATISVGEHEPALSMDLPVLLACAFVKGPLPAGLVALVGTVDLNEVRGAITPSLAAWNHAQVSLSVIAAGWIFSALGGNVGEWPLALLCATAALASDVIVNYVAVALMDSLATGRGFVAALGLMRIGNPRRFGLIYAAFGLSSILMAEVYMAIGFLGFS
jgi:hypothetical protein